MHDDLATAVQQHEDIIAAIERRDADAAVDIVRAHLELSRRNMAMYVTPEGLALPPEPQPADQAPA